ncbi:MAG TPA: helix-turn-helix domain-containing protein [Polyangiaceae bacterium]
MARSIEQTGDGWTQLILRDALLGARRFQDFEARLGIPPNTLTRRLEALVEHGFFERRCYEERPRREEYHLTEKGRDFAPVLLALAAWGNRWLAPRGSILECTDPATGLRFEPVVIDRQTGRELVAGNVGLRAGPGASVALRKALGERFVLFGSASCAEDRP